MILDSSALVAIFFQEEGWEGLVDKIFGASGNGVGAPTLVEAAIVTSARMKADSRALLTRFLAEAKVEVLPLDEVHWGVAAGAWLRFGKGRHPAALNFGDCLSYAVSRVSDMPLLCVGEDFARTDLVLA